MIKPVLLVLSGVLMCWQVQLFAGDYNESEQTVSLHRNTEITTTIPIKELAARWRISEQEYSRYLQIINGPLGRWNKDIDPVFALGIFAETPTEQRRYAELLARQEQELALRTIEFERAYRRAFQRLYPNANMIDDRLMEPYFRKHQKYTNRLYTNHSENTQPVFQSGDRILFFADPENGHRCIDDLNKLVNASRSSTGVMIDVYVLNARNESDVNHWANEQRLDVSLVGNTITLNTDNGVYQKLISDQDQESGSSFLSRGDQLYRIDMQQLRE